MNKTSQGKSVISIISVGLWFILGQSPDVWAAEIENVKKGVVKITVEKPGDVIETGAGIVLAARREAFFILTAYHVIDEAQSIWVTFYEYPAEKFAAKLFEKYDQANDIAVIYIRNSGVPKGIPKLQLGDVSKINELDKVFAIGHPAANEWEFSSAEVRSSELSQFRFSGDAVDPGNSGGALLNKEFQLIGLITKERPGNGIALKIDDALEILKNWQIPFDFELKRSGRKWGWWVAGLGLAGGAAAILALGGGDGDGKGTLVITVQDPSN